MPDDRDNDPAWKAARYACYSRDNFTCCLCNSKGKELNCHHILKWSEHPQLRYVLSNLVTLCVGCHEMVTGKEGLFVEEFQRIVAQKKIEQQLKSGNKPKKIKKNDIHAKWRPRNPKLKW